MSVVETSVEVDAPRERVWKVVSDPTNMPALRGILEGKVETSLHPLDGDRTLLRQRVEYRFIGGPLGGLAARGVKLLGASVLLKRGVLAQKRQAESTS